MTTVLSQPLDVDDSNVDIANEKAGGDTIVVEDECLDMEPEDEVGENEDETGMISDEIVSAHGL